MADDVEDVGGGEEAGHLDREREGRIAGILLPAVLPGHRAVADEEARRLLDHRQEAVRVGGVDMAVTAQHVGEDDGEGAFVHLDPAPIGPAVEPDILRPVAVRLLHRGEIGQHGLGLLRRAGGEEAARRLDEIARPDEMIAAEILVALVEAPGD